MAKDGKGFYRYWGKAGKEEDAAHDAGAATHHLLAYHNLDVAAVGQVLLARLPRLLQALHEILELGVDTLRQWVVFFLSIHDIGKLCGGFQRQRPDLWQASETSRRKEHHTIAADALWRGYLGKQVVMPLLVTDIDLQDALTQWAATVTGHHGYPAEGGYCDSIFCDDDLAAATSYCRDLAALLLPGPITITEEQAELLELRVGCASWMLAGLAVLCDWLGSNRRFFPYHDQPMPLETYWEQHALPAAERVVSSSGLLPAPSSPLLGFHELFSELADPTPLQRLAAEIPLGDGPNLLIIEDLTGSGKTEAAVTLVHRLLAAGIADSLYLALPTMATADAMYQRVSKIYRRLFMAGSRPSLVLAHSSSDLSEEYQTSIVAEGAPEEDLLELGEQDASATCNAWLADSRKKALLAQIGVGTIDQALLGVLHSRHQSLRLLGLEGKVLVIDEVHACDTYQNGLLTTLLEYHAMNGGSTVLLSATLPKAVRQELVNTYRRVAGVEEGHAVPLTSSEYPLLTRVSEHGAQELQPKTGGSSDHRPAEQRELRLSLVSDAAWTANWVMARAREGGCVAWIRSSVADAIEAYNAVKDQLGPGMTTLFHARFALCDRLSIESRVLKHFGLKSGPQQRSGRVVIATQVAEQSLDLDFDFMVSDLAFIDLLLQRAGRLRRHPRDLHGTRLEQGEDQRGTPELLVLAPPFTEQPPADWLSSFQKNTELVYRHTGRLWLTARLITTRPVVQLPRDSRDLIEEVYSAAAQERIPKGLQEKTNAAEGERRAGASFAHDRVITLEHGYGSAGRYWSPDEQARTRLGEPTTTLRLALWQNGQLLPWAQKGHLPWRLSEVRVRRVRVAASSTPADEELAAAVEATTTQWPGKGKWHVIIPLVPAENGSWSGTAMAENGSEVAIRYDDKRGLEVT